MTKELLNPKVGVLPVVDWDASVSFTTEAISFPQEFGWSIDFQFDGVTPGTPTYTILVSNSETGVYHEYKTESTLVDLTDATKWFVFDDTSSFRYMKITYVSGGSTGNFTVNVCK